MKSLSLDEPFYSSLVKRLVKLLKRVDFLFLLIFVLAFAARFHYTTDFIMNDEVGGGYRGYGYLAWGYFDSAKVVHDYLSHADLAGLYSWAVNTDANYPFLQFLMSASMFLLNSPTLLAARLPIEMLGALLAAVIYLLGRDLFSKFAGLASGLFVALDPVLIAYSRVAYLDIPMELFVAISVFTLYRGLTRHSRMLIILSGVTCGLAVLSKVTAWLVLPFVFLLFFLWKFRSGERYGLMARNLAAFMLSFIFVVLAVFPWVGYQILTGRYFSWLFFISSPVLSNVSQSGSSSIITFIVGKLTIVELCAFGLGVTVAVWQVLRAKYRFSNVVALLWFLLAFLSLQLMPLKLNQYVVFLIPSVLLIAGYGVFSFAGFIGKLLQMQTKFAFLLKPEVKRTLSVALLLLVGGSQLVTVLQYYPYLSLYSSPLIGDPFQTFGFQGEEGIPAAVDFLRNHVPEESVIAVAGQAHLFTYYLPEYRIVGLSELYPYSDEPLAFLYLSRIEYLVVQTDVMHMFGKTDPILERLTSLRLEDVSKAVGHDLIWIYNLSGIYQTLLPNILNEDWETYQGNVTEENDRFTLSIAPNYAYTYAIKELGEVNAGSRVTFAWEVSGLNVDSLRVEIWSNQSNIANLYPPRKEGIWTFDISEFITGIRSPLRLILVAGGKSSQFLELKSLLFLRWSSQS